MASQQTEEDKRIYGTDDEDDVTLESTPDNWREDFPHDHSKYYGCVVE